MNESQSIKQFEQNQVEKAKNKILYKWHSVKGKTVKKETITDLQGQHVRRENCLQRDFRQLFEVFENIQYLDCSSYYIIEYFCTSKNSRFDWI